MLLPLVTGDCVRAGEVRAVFGHTLFVGGEYVQAEEELRQALGQRATRRYPLNMSGHYPDIPEGQSFVATHGSVHGILFENSPVKPWFSWSFHFECAEIKLAEESIEPNVQVEWVRLPVPSWRKLEGARASAEEFGTPFEASAYFFAHLRYERTTIEVVRQSGTTLSVRARLEGDLDGLGLDRIEIEAPLEFKGIYVQLEGSLDAEESRRQLAKFTDVEGLSAYDNGHNWLFKP